MGISSAPGEFRLVPIKSGSCSRCSEFDDIHAVLQPTVGWVADRRPFRIRVTPRSYDSSTYCGSKKLRESHSLKRSRFPIKKLAAPRLAPVTSGNDPMVSLQDAPLELLQNPIPGNFYLREKKNTAKQESLGLTF